jgi:hypothetical protein
MWREIQKQILNSDWSCANAQINFCCAYAQVIDLRICAAKIDLRIGEENSFYGFWIRISGLVDSWIRATPDSPDI